MANKPSALDQFKAFAQTMGKAVGNDLTTLNGGKPSVVTNLLKGRSWNANLPNFGGVISPLPERAPIAQAMPTPQPQGRVLGSQASNIPVRSVITAAPTKPPITATPTPTPAYDPKVFTGYVIGTPKQYIPIINQAARKFNMPTNMLSALLAHESMRWNPDVISGKLKSPAGAIGIAQFMPATAKGMGFDPTDPTQAIPAAAQYYMTRFKQLQSPERTLASYNAGLGAVNDYMNGTNYTGNNPKLIKTANGVPPYPETQGYVKYIMQDAGQTFGNPDYYKL